MKAEIANRLYEYRRASGMSQEKVAALLGVSRQAVSKWECAESSPDTDNLIALAQLYGVSIDELLFADPEEGAGEEAVAVIEAVEEEPEEDAADEPVEEEVIEEVIEEEVEPEDDGKDYAHISLANGVHVKDSKKGEEVHVDWDGIHIDTAEDEHIHIDFKNFKNIAAAVRELRKKGLE